MGPRSIKVGRNHTCPCGSGKKYKKCCLFQDAGSSQKHPSTNLIDQQQSKERLKQRIQKNMGDNFKLLQGELELKMSEVILHLAEDLLDSARNKSHIEKAITIACMAWNLAILFDPEQQEEKLEEFLNKIKDVQGRQDTRDIINSLIQKKHDLYPNIHRIILDFELVGDKNNFHLNIVSTIPEGLIER
jgi:hypothetical protein